MSQKSKETLLRGQETHRPREKIALAVHSTRAHEKYGKGLKTLVSQLCSKVREIYTHKGYQAQSNTLYLENLGIKSYIQKKASN